MSVSTYTKSGTKATTAVTLDKTVFGVETENHELLKLAYHAYLANGRENIAVTKTRGLVSGGGRKPWKQKGTGRARFGSSRVPIWRGGGVVFGPTGEENYTKKMSAQSRRTAIRQALTLAATSDNIKVIESFEPKDGKSSAAAKLLSKVEATGRVLVVVHEKDDLTMRATRNLKNVQVVTANYINVYDVLNADAIVMTKKAVEAIDAWLGGAA